MLYLILSFWTIELAKADAKYVPIYRCAVETLKVAPSLGQPSRLAQEQDLLITSVEDPRVSQSPILLIYNETSVVAYTLSGHSWQSMWVEVPNSDSRRPSTWFYMRYRHSLLFKNEYQDFKVTAAPPKALQKPPLAKNDLERLKPDRILLLSVSEKLEEVEAGIKTGFVSRRDLLLGNLSLCQNIQTSAKDLALKVQYKAAELFDRSPSFNRAPAGI